MDRRDLKEGQEVYVKGRVIHTGDHLDIVLDEGSFIENAIILHHEKPVIPQKERRERMENLLRYRAWDKIRKKMGVVISNNWMTGVANIIIDNKEALRQKQDYILMQSTGIKDKNGTEIFEGDIVKTTRFFGRVDEVGGFYEYDKEIIGIVKQLEGAWVIDTGSEAVDLWTEIEENSVIGNVCESPFCGGKQ